ncbi:class I tRNA ligase family protein [Paraburkholderia sediminicola]|uniref:Class I tRNA ligase family protein n=1 Tax=Paraburkholderia rhynchosiae TaxID=487049 RepID=A0ACC7NBX7_9BURK
MGPRKYLLVAAMPTPNGALHLGHVGAQYLPLDVFRRYQEQQGNRVAYYGGFDVFDNAVCVAAQRNGRTPQEHAAVVTSQITAELQYLDIHIDGLINYADAAHSALARQLVGQLRETYGSRVSSRVAKFPFDETGRPLGGNWLRGRCAHCKAAVKGYACDLCGRSLLPSELIDPETIDGSAIHWHAVALEFVTAPVQGLRAYLESLPCARPYLPLVTGRLDAPELRLQWTNVDSWGLSLGGGAVVYNRNFTLVEQLLLGDLARARLDLKENAFCAASDVVSILAYGKDNAGLLLADIPALAMATGYYQPYTYQWISPFYKLDSRKMSTSGNHAIWVRDASGSDAEAIRMYVCRKFDVRRDVDLSLAELCGEEVAHARLVDLVRSAIAQASRTGRPSDGVSGVLARLRATVRDAMQDGIADIAVFPRAIDEWVSLRPSASATQWLLGLAELAAPLLPRLTREIDEHMEVSR